MRLIHWDKTPSVVVGGSRPTYQAEAAAAGQPELVYISEKGTKYHRENCPSGFKAKRALPVEEAVSEGYEACKMCLA